MANVGETIAGSPEFRISENKIAAVPDIDHFENDVFGQIRRLARITNQIRVLGMLIAATTLISLAFVGLIAAPVSLTTSNVRFLSLVLVTFNTCVLIVLVAREYLVRTGDTLFEEISDELQWHVLGELKSSSGLPFVDGVLDELKALRQQPSTRPPLEIRVALRLFAKSTDLPLVKGSLGTTMYALLNLANFGFGVYLLMRYT
jgi:hypothetical protein